MILKSKISSKDTLRLSLVVLAFLAVFVCFTGNSDAATINVGSGAGNDSATIQGAINSPEQMMLYMCIEMVQVHIMKMLISKSQI